MLVVRIRPPVPEVVLVGEVRLVSPPQELYNVEGPLEERRQVETPWGPAWAEVGTYVLERQDTGDRHIVHPVDFPLQYMEAV